MCPTAKHGMKNFFELNEFQVSNFVFQFPWKTKVSFSFRFLFYDLAEKWFQFLIFAFQFHWNWFLISFWFHQRMDHLMKTEVWSLVSWRIKEFVSEFLLVVSHVHVLLSACVIVASVYTLFIRIYSGQYMDWHLHDSLTPFISTLCKISKSQHSDDKHQRVDSKNMHSS